MRSPGTYRKGHKTSKEIREKISKALLEFNKTGVRRRDLPWYKTYRNIGKRITCKKDSYMLQGIKSFITPEELKVLWFRDKAYLMKKPSIDRIKNTGHYTFKNCQYIEHKLNSVKRNCSMKRNLKRGIV